MDDSLQRYGRGTTERWGAKVPREERPVVAQAISVRNEVRLAAFQVAASTALAGFAGEELCELYDDFRDLAKEDAAKSMFLGELFGNSLGQVKKCQRRLFDPWGF